MEGLNQYLSAANQTIIGKEQVAKLVLANFLIEGNTLIEDVPGVGKTTLVRFFANIFDLKLSRIQFTNDLLPADILGLNIFDAQKNEFIFHEGPIFGDIIMADELNRAPPRTQSALLQAMEEKEVTIDGKTYKLSNLFHVMATQNPHSQVGTYDLPESQLDRFSLKLSIGYADKESTIAMLKEKSSNSNLPTESKISLDWIHTSKDTISKTHISDAIYEYIYRLMEKSRLGHGLPLSNRAGIDLARLSSAWAYLNNETSVLPEHVQFIAPFVLGHRMVRPGESSIELEHKLVKELIQSTDLR